MNDHRPIQITAGMPLTQKYAPLPEPIADAHHVNSMIEHRLSRVLGKSSSLSFHFSWDRHESSQLADPDQCSEAIDITKHAPLIVVSSMRSAAVTQGFMNTARIYNQHTLAPVTAQNIWLEYGYDDQHPHLSFIYDPLREEAFGRNVYLLVHASELPAYRRMLRLATPAFEAAYRSTSVKSRPRRVTLVGWRGGGQHRDVIGFGATRIASIELARYLLAATPHGQQSLAWVIDDNIAMTRGFTGFHHLERLMLQQKCIGMSVYGTGVRSGVKAIRSACETQNDEKKSSDVIKSDGVMHQLVCWNMEALVKTNACFSPAFVASAEDVSFNAYLRKNNKSADVAQVLTSQETFKIKSHLSEEQLAEKIFSTSGSSAARKQWLSWKRVITRATTSRMTLIHSIAKQEGTYEIRSPNRSDSLYDWMSLFYRDDVARRICHSVEQTLLRMYTKSGLNPHLFDRLFTRSYPKHISAPTVMKSAGRGIQFPQLEQKSQL